MRRITGPDGQFGGMMVASVEPSYFSDFYRNVDLGRRGSIDLYQDNGSILLASTSEVPAADATPNVAWAPTFDLAATLGSFRSPPSETNRRLVAFHRAGSYPLVVAVSIDLVDIKPALVADRGSDPGGSLRHRAARHRGRRDGGATTRRATAGASARPDGAEARGARPDDRKRLARLSQSPRRDDLDAPASSANAGPDEQILKAAEEAVERTGSGLITQLLAFSKRNDLQVRSADINGLLGGLEQVLRYAAGPGVALRLERGRRLCPSVRPTRRSSTPR